LVSGRDADVGIDFYVDIHGKEGAHGPPSQAVVALHVGDLGQNGLERLQHLQAKAEGSDTPAAS
jgi:hypothetical protein